MPKSEIRSSKKERDLALMYMLTVPQVSTHNQRNDGDHELPPQRKNRLLPYDQLIISLPIPKSNP